MNDCQTKELLYLLRLIAQALVRLNCYPVRLLAQSVPFERQPEQEDWAAFQQTMLQTLAEIRRGEH